MAASMETYMFIMFNMHACSYVLAWGIPYTHTHPHPHLPTLPTPKGGDPPNQLKCYNT